MLLAVFGMRSWSGQAFPETHVEVRGHSKRGLRREKGGTEDDEMEKGRA